MVIELFVWIRYGPSQRITFYPEDWEVSSVIEYAVKCNRRLSEVKITNPGLYARKMDKVYRFFNFMSSKDYYKICDNVYLGLDFKVNPYPYLHVLSECVRIPIRTLLFLLSHLYWWDEEMVQHIKELDFYFTPENFSDYTILKFIYIVMKYVIFFITLTPTRLCKK
jgi:hypothetical protein